MPVFGALAGIASTALAGAMTHKGQKDANEANLRIAREQMGFQERMSGSAYQRAVRDMKLAGINPMLAYEQGGASSPGGASATMESTLGPAVSSAQHARRLTQELRNMKEANKVAKADVNLKYTQTAKERAVANQAQSAAHLNVQHEFESEARTELLKLDRVSAKVRAEVSASAVGKSAAYLTRIRQVLYGGKGPVSR